MAIAWTDARPIGPRIEGRVFSVPRKSSVVFVPLGEPVGVWLHRVGKRSLPHEDVNCPYCPGEQNKKGYVPAVVWAFHKGNAEYSWQKGAFELTYNCLHDWSEDLIGNLVKATRMGEQANGKVSIELCMAKPKIPVPATDTFDVMPLLLRVWGMIGRGGQMLRKPSEVLPFRAAQ